MSGGFLVLAGPQCGGKTTVKNYLYARFMVLAESDVDDPMARQNLILLQEMRQLIMHERGIHSGIFIDADTEAEIIRRDLERMTEIIRVSRNRVFLEETNVFTLAHAHRRGFHIERYLAEYRSRLGALDAGIIFLNVPPNISWSRRKPRYEERVAGFPPDQAATVLQQYRIYLEGIYSELHGIADHLDIPIQYVDASGSVEETLEASAHAFMVFANQRQLGIFARF